MFKVAKSESKGFKDWHRTTFKDVETKYRIDCVLHGTNELKVGILSKFLDSLLC